MLDFAKELSTTKSDEFKFIFFDWLLFEKTWFLGHLFQFIGTQNLPVTQMRLLCLGFAMLSG